VVRTTGGEERFAVKGGTVEVLNNVVTVLAA
jgi:F0F1-type ATP synthase epsilon subunit